MEGFLGGLAILVDPWVMLMVFLGTVLGIFVGALPGISGSTTIALMLPMTIAMGPIPAICFLGAIYCAANFGGSITAIMVNAPGDPSASATALEGYKMAEKGQAGLALGMSAVSSSKLRTIDRISFEETSTVTRYGISSPDILPLCLCSKPLIFSPQ